MRKLLLLVALVAFGTGCDDSSSGGGDKDGSTANADCPTAAPDEGAGLSGTCCFRKSNADDENSPELRLSSIKLAEPAALSSPVIVSALQSFLDAETFNWLVRFDDLDGSPTFTTGFGERNSDNTFSFRASDDEFAPAEGAGMFSGENFTTSQVDQTIVVPILDAETLEPTVKFVLTALQIESAQLSEDRSCVGSRIGKTFDASKGGLSAFITLADAKPARVTIAGAFDTSLCDLLAGMLTPEYDEAKVCLGDQATWTNPPNSKCENGTCTHDPGDESVCSKADCNAWYLEAAFAAQGVEITDEPAAGSDAGTSDGGDAG